MKDPYLKPVIFSGLLITLLTIIFAPGIFLWAIVGGYVAVKLSYKLIKEIISIKDSLLLGLFSGIIGGTCLNLLSILTFNDPHNQKILISTLKNHWPNELAVPDFYQMLPSIFFITCILIVLISVVFSVLGSYFGFVMSKHDKKIKS